MLRAAKWNFALLFILDQKSQKHTNNLFCFQGFYWVNSASLLWGFYLQGKRVLLDAIYTRNTKTFSAFILFAHTRITFAGRTTLPGPRGQDKMSWTGELTYCMYIYTYIYIKFFF